MMDVLSSPHGENGDVDMLQLANFQPEVLTRSELARRAGSAPQRGLLLCSADAALALPLGPEGVQGAEELTAETLVMAGIEAADRVVVALNNDGAGVGVVWARAAASIAAASCMWGPRQHRRLARLLDTVDADVLVTTPTLARRLLVASRLEGTAPRPLRLLLLTGEPGARDLAELAAGFRAEVGEIWADPVLGMAVAAAPGGGTVLEAPRPGLLEHAEVAGRPTVGGVPVGEWLLAPPWPALEDVRIRTGLVSERPADGGLRAPRWTVGDHVLVRGRWLWLPLVHDVAERFGLGDGTWSLEVHRSLLADEATFVTDVGGELRDRIERTLRESSPVHISMRSTPAAPTGRWTTGYPWFRDLRRQHLGR